MRLQTPRGLKDFLPEDARWKLSLEQKTRDTFTSWGYSEVITPTFEFLEVLQLGESANEQTFKFLGNDGQVLALRPDVTTPIARMVATRFKDEPKPLRLSYLSNVFRRGEVQLGRQREFYQAGVELIGSDKPAADGEVIALAAEVFRLVGLEDFRIDLGQVKFFQGIMEECDQQATKQEIRDALLVQDYVGLQQVVEQSNLTDNTKELLLNLPSMRGGKETFAKARASTDNATARQAVTNLEQIYHVLEGYGVADKIRIDFSMVKPLGYYTGMILEGYAPKLGFALCSGGRYDNLNAQFGKAQPATGMALGLERLMLSLEMRGKREKFAVPDVFVIGETKAVLAYAQEQRAAGFSVEVDVQGLSADQAREYGEHKQIPRIVQVDSEGVRRIGGCQSA